MNDLLNWQPPQIPTRQKRAQSDYLRHIMGGADGDCPTCGRYGKVYKRQINTAMILMLRNLYRTAAAAALPYPDAYFHISDFLGVRGIGSGDLGKLAYWQLIESKIDPDDDSKRCSGWWRITRKGRQFIDNSLVVPKYSYVFDGEVIKQSENQLVSVVDCIGKKFDYSELMNATV